MVIYEVEGEDGKVYEVEGEDSASTAPAEQSPMQGAMSALGNLVTGPANAVMSGETPGMADMATAAMSPSPGSLAALAGRVMQRPSELIREKLYAENHPILGEIAGFATDPTNLAGGVVGAGMAKGAVRGAARMLAGATEGAFPKLSGKMMQVFAKPSVVLPNALGGPIPMAEAKAALNSAEREVLGRLKATSLEELDRGAKVLERSRSGLQDDVVRTVDQIRINQTISKSQQLAGKVTETKVPVEKLIQAEKALKARISKLWDEGFGDYAQAMEQELDRVSALVDKALPQLKNARSAFHLSKLREEVTTGIMDMPLAGVSMKRTLFTPGVTAYGQAALGGIAKPFAGVAGGATGSATTEAVDRLSRRYLPRKE